jgi:hypothetical protein
MNSTSFGGLAAVAALVVGCTGSVDPPGGGGTGAGSGSGGTGTGGSPGTGGSSPYATGGSSNGTGGDGSGAAASGGTGMMTPENPGGTEVLPFEATDARTQVRKVKGLLTGLAPTETEIQTVLAAPDAAEALRGLIDVWTSPAHPEFYEFFQDKFLVFFTNAFQQTGFTPTEDFKPQLLENGGFDLGPIGVFGDDAFPKLVQNLEESFARTALHIMENDQPFTDVLTTRQLMMTTALMSLYIQIEMPNDQPFNFGGQQQEKLAWQIDMTGVGSDGSPTDADRTAVEIPIEQAVKTMLFDDRPPVMQGSSFGGNFGGTCTPEIKNEQGYSLLFQRLFGYTQRTPFSANIQCIEHASLPYYTASDLSDWRLVTLSDGANHPEMYDLPALRETNQLGLALPRVSFFTTPAYLALWNTNDSNKHRVTANQTLLVALGEALTAENEISAVSTVGLDPEHSPSSNPECYGCHKILDPLKQFWESYFDFQDRNDFQVNRFGGQTVRPERTNGGALSFRNVNAEGTTLGDLGQLLARVEDDNQAVKDEALRLVNRFAISFAQKLCYYADSAACTETDPEFRRVALAFQNSNFNFKTLIRELFSSPLVTGAANTETFGRRNVVVSVARRDQLCQALSNRLGRPDICAQRVPFPFSNGFGGPQGQSSTLSAQRAISRIAGSMPADAFSRGSEQPVASIEPTLFYRAASELICETVAAQVVDTDSAPFTSSNLEGSLDAMVQSIIGYTSSDPLYPEALQILKDHYAEALVGRTATQALQSTFALACQSPTSVSFGL